jgi:hypothetical protein
VIGTINIYTFIFSKRVFCIKEHVC